MKTLARAPRKISYSDVSVWISVRPVAMRVAIGLPSVLTKAMPASLVLASLICSSTPAHLTMSTAFERMSTLAPVRRRDGARSTIVILALGYALRREKAKTLPAMPEPDMRTLGEAMFDRMWM